MKRSILKVPFLAFAALTLSAASPPPSIEIQVTNLRGDKGLIHLCISSDPVYFLKCKEDPNALTLSRSARVRDTLRFEDVPPGVYAIAIVHDENGNGELDTFMSIPREGFGFSRNPAIRLGPPRFDDVKFAVAAGKNSHQIRMKYLL